MEPWDHWNRDQAAPENSNQGNFSNELYHPQAQQFMAQPMPNNFDDQCQEHMYYSNEGIADGCDQAALRYLPDQVQQEQNSYPNNYEHQGASLVEYSREQYSSMGTNSNELIDINSIQVAEAAARCPSHYEFQQEPSQTYQGTNYVTSSLPPPNHGIGGQQATFQNNERDYAADHSSLYAQQDGDMFGEPVPKRMRTKHTDDSLASSFQRQEQQFSSLMASEAPSQEKSREMYPEPPVPGFGGKEEGPSGAPGLEPSHTNTLARFRDRPTVTVADPGAEGPDDDAMRDMNNLIDSLFDDAPSRDPFAADESAAALPSSANNVASDAVKDGTGHAEPGMFDIDDGIFDDAEDDIELPVALRQTTVLSAPLRPVDAVATSTTQLIPITDLSSSSSIGQSAHFEPLGKTADESHSGNDARASDAVSEANESTFSDATDDVTIKVIETAKASAKTANKGKKVKKKQQKSKPKPQLTKPIAAHSLKEKAAAEKLLAGKTDLTLVLPENACHFLGKEFWIFTVQQFQHVFDASSESYSDPKMILLRQEIRNELAKRLTINEEEAKSTDYDVAGLAPTGIESLLRIPRDGTDADLSMSQSTAPATASVTGEHPIPEEANDHSEETVHKENETGDCRGDSAEDNISEPKEHTLKSANSIAENFEEKYLPLVTNDGSSQQVTSEMLIQEGSATTGTDPVHVDGANKGGAMLLQNHTSSTERENVASKILESWVNRLAKWKQEASTLQTEKESLGRAKTSFSLQGPLGVLLPEVIHNFLASISVSTAYDFFSVRFTEASPGIQALNVWRHLCGLESLKAAVLARHMAGIAMRLEKALSSVPPADAYTRTWMGTALACLTASAKEFLIDECKLQTAEDFLDTKTTYFSDKLVTWRASKQKSVLKGSGRVAMISSFKAHVRDSLAAEDAKTNGPGRVSSEDVLIELSKTMFPSEPVENDDAVNHTAKQTAPKKKSKKPVQELTESHRQNSEAALSSPEFLQKVLRPENVEFLASQGINTPAQLMQAEKNEDAPLVIEMIKWKTALAGKQALANSCARLLFDWQSKVKDELQRVARGDTGKESTKKRPRAADVEKTDAKMPSQKRSRPSANKNLRDALQVLSTMALTFLESIDIMTADQFLSTRTSEIANDFMTWREQEKMTVLKGTGHSATISGWKAAVRKAAESMGDDDLAMTDPYSDSQRPSRVSSTPAHISSPLPKTQIDSVSHPRLLRGLPRRRFFVRDSKDDGVYDFELSVRKSTTGFGVYLTYLGRNQLLKTSSPAEVEGRSLSMSVDADWSTDSFLPVLQDVGASTILSTTSTDTFVTPRPGCGLIEVGRYVAIPLSSEVEQKVFPEIEQFLHNRPPDKESSEPNKDCRLDCSTSNVLIQESPENGTRCFFYASEPLEKGQVVELRFSPRHEMPCLESMAGPFAEVVDRLSLARTVSLLPLADIAAVVDQLNKAAGANRRDIERCKTLEQQGDNSQTQLSCDPTEELQFQILQRRIDWLATQILQNLEDEATEGKQTLATDPNDLIERIKKLLMTADECRGFCSYAKQHGEDCALKELSFEILCDTVLNNPTIPWSDKSTWCDISTNLLKQCLRTASVHLLNCLSGEESRDVMLNEMESDISGAVKRVILLERDLKELAFPVCSESNEALGRDFVMANLERLPKDVVAKAMQEDAYKNAMDLCDEVAYDNVGTASQKSTVQTLLVLATKAPWNPKATIMRYIDDVQKKNAQLDTEWYIENQILSVAHAIASNKVLWSSPYGKEGAKPDSSYTRFAQVARHILEDAPTDDQCLVLEKPRETSETNAKLKYFPVVSRGTAENKAVPSTLPLFLAIVWPRLKSVYGFSIEVGDEPNDVTYFPPGHKGQFQRASDRQLRAQRLERARKRMKIGQQTKEVGFGNLPKLTKRAFISATRADLESKHGASVSDAIKQFVTSVLSDLPGRDDAECRRRMTAIEQAMNQCFDELIPLMRSSDDSDPKDSASLNSAYLMQVLLVLPSLLEQSGLPMRRIEDTLGVIRDVANFVTSRNSELFAEPLRLCHEEYEAGRDVPHPFLSPRMQQLVPKMSADATGPESSQDPNLIREIVTPEDKRELTGFVGTVMSQFLPCRASEYDSSSRGRKGIRVGYPGIMCRHCVGKSNEGKYFFTSLDSLNTAATATLGHLYKCPNMPQEIKTKIAHLKTRHGEERLALQKGAQAQFYSRLWKRLWSKDGIPDAPVILANHASFTTEKAIETATQDDQQQQQQQRRRQLVQSPLEFKSHTDLLQYLVTTSPWSEKSDIQERIEQYYGCIAFGGQVYNTNIMPKNHFSSEWILSQILPPERLSTKRLYLSG